MIAKILSWVTLERLLLFVFGPIMSLVYLDTIKDPFFSTQRDFGVFYTASALFLRGDILVLFEPEAFKAALVEIMGKDFPYLPFPYPPHSLLFMWPLALFPFLIALTIWLVAGFGGIMAGLARHLRTPWIAFAGLLICPTSAVNIAGGQNGFLSAALLCGGLLQLPRRPVLAGILFGLLSYKPQLGLLIPLLLMTAGYWRAFWVASVTVILLVALSMLVLGYDSWVLYATKSGPLQLTIVQHWIGRFQSMSPTYFMSGRLLGFDLWLSWTVQIGAGLAAIAASIWAFRQEAPHGLKAAVAMVAVFMISPYILTYDMPIVAIAILLAISTFRPTWWEYAIFAAVWGLPAVTLTPQVPIGPVLISMLFMVLLRRVILLRDTPPGATLSKPPGFAHPG